MIEYLKGDKSLIEPYRFEELFINDIVVMELYQGTRSKSDLNFIVKNISDFKILKSHDEIMKLATALKNPDDILIHNDISQIANFSLIHGETG